MEPHLVLKKRLNCNKLVNPIININYLILIFIIFISLCILIKYKSKTTNLQKQQKLSKFINYIKKFK